MLIKKKQVRHLLAVGRSMFKKRAIYWVGCISRRIKNNDPKSGNAAVLFEQNAANESDEGDGQGAHNHRSPTLSADIGVDNWPILANPMNLNIIDAQDWRQIIW